MNEEDIKGCSKCETISSKSNFYKDISKRDGLLPTFKICGIG